jgi:phenylalanyl-tRNA synthetase alpha chain
MLEQIEQIRTEIEAARISDAEQFRIAFLGRNGSITALFEYFRNLPSDQKKETGKILNELKIFAQQKLADFREQENSGVSGNSFDQDLTRPAVHETYGARHPISLVKNEILSIFTRLGFTVADGPEIEDDWHNFTALNFPPEHPARDMQDTIFVSREPDYMLRTHTTSVQVRLLEHTPPPIRILMPGRVYRNEAISARAHCFFHQVDGVYIDRNVSFADLKQTLLYFAREMFSADTRIRLRPSYFPFTEPSAEMDISCILCGGKGCAMCKKTGWVEILGCGMVDPNVLQSSGVDPDEFSGFAFGMGVERITNLKYQVKDLRLFSENDVRFLAQFRSAL